MDSVITNDSIKRWILDCIRSDRFIETKFTQEDIVDQSGRILQFLLDQPTPKDESTIKKLLLWAVGADHNSDFETTFKSALKSSTRVQESILRRLDEIKTDWNRVVFYKLTSLMCDKEKFASMVLEDATQKEDELLRANVINTLANDLLLYTMSDSLQNLLCSICETFDDHLRNPDQFDLLYKLSLCNSEWRERLITMVNNYLNNTAYRHSEMEFCVVFNILGKGWVELGLHKHFLATLIDGVDRMRRGTLANMQMCLAVFHSLEDIFIHRWVEETRELVAQIHLDEICRKYEQTPFPEYRVAFIKLIGALCSSEEGLITLKDTRYPLVEYLCNSSIEPSLGLKQDKFDLLTFLSQKRYTGAVLGQAALYTIKKTVSEGFTKYAIVKKHGFEFEVGKETA